MQRQLCFNLISLEEEGGGETGNNHLWTEYNNLNAIKPSLPIQLASFPLLYDGNTLNQVTTSEFLPFYNRGTVRL